MFIGARNSNIQNGGGGVKIPNVCKPFR